MKFALFTALTMVAFLVVPQLSLAQSQLVPNSCATDVRQCNLCTLLEMGGNIVNLLFQLLVIVAVILIVVAGLKLVTSAGNQNALESAKSMLTNVIIGFVIVMAAWLIVDTIFKMLVQDTRFGVWNRIEGNCGGVKSTPLPNTGNSGN